MGPAVRRVILAFSSVNHESSGREIFFKINYLACPSVPAPARAGKVPGWRPDPSCSTWNRSSRDDRGSAQFVASTGQAQSWQLRLQRGGNQLNVQLGDLLDQAHEALIVQFSGRVIQQQSGFDRGARRK